MTLDRLEDHKPTSEVTPLELFFDLVFVYGVSQLSHHLLEHLTWRGVAEMAVLLLATFTVWSYTSWEATIVSVTQTWSKAKMLVVMLVGLFMNASIPEAFGDSGWAFVMPYVLIQIGRTTWTLLMGKDPLFREHFRRTLLWITATAPLWVLGATASPESRLWWWGLAAGIDLAGTALAHPFFGRRLQSENVGFDGEHMLERARLFLLIALGETVVVTGTAISAAPKSWMTLLTGSVALSITVALWALAFGRTNQLANQYFEETRNPIRASLLSVNSLTVIVAGLILLAVAVEWVIAHPYAPGSATLSALLFGGPLLVVLMQAWYLWVMPQVLSRLRLAGVAVLVLGGLIALAVPAFVALILAGVILLGLALLEHQAQH